MRRMEDDAATPDGASEGWAALTPNQIVAFNLYRARALRGWTQQEAAERLEKYLGTRWSKASFSAAERSVAGERVRQFSADEITAFAIAFDLPIGWFFLPPGASEHVRRLRTVVEVGGGWLRVGDMLELVLNVGEDEFETRIAEIVADLPDDAQSALQRAAREAVAVLTRTVLGEALRDLSQWPNDLRRLADLLEQARSDVISELRERLHGGEEQ